MCFLYFRSSITTILPAPVHGEKAGESVAELMDKLNVGAANAQRKGTAITGPLEC